MRGAVENLIDYQLQGCTYDGNEIWNCPCDGRFSVLITPEYGVSHGYDIIVGYYSDLSMSDGYKRTEEYNNLIFEPYVGKKVSFGDAMPSGSFATVIIIVIVLLLLSAYPLYRLVKRIINAEENQ